MVMHPFSDNLNSLIDILEKETLRKKCQNLLLTF